MLITTKDRKNQAIYKERRANKNNIQMIELRINIFDLLDFKSTTLTEKKAYTNLEKRRTRRKVQKKHHNKKTYHSKYIL